LPLDPARAIRGRVLATRTAPAIVLVACLPSAALEPAVLVSHDCRGSFEAEVPVVKRGVRKLAVVYEITPGAYNVTEIVRSPERETIAGKRKRSKIEVRGRVEDPCEDAGLDVFASYVPGGHASFVGIPSVVSTSTLDAPRADAADGSFAYPLEITCCRAGSHALRVRGLDNVAEVAAEPSTIECTGTEEQLVAVRGRLASAATSGRVQIEIAATGTNHTCTVADEITPSSR
jgi:hypothetical protein